MLNISQYNYIDIHSHQYNSNQEVLTIYNSMDGVLSKCNMNSVGIHPNYPERLSFEYMQQQLAEPNIIAIGECGLDKNSTTPWKIQVKLFEQQLLLASDENIPLIVHCVKSFGEVFSMIKGIEIPVVFHGFRKHIQLATTIVHSGCYLSFGVDMLRQDAINKNYDEIPLNHVFMETDNSLVNIESIYEAGSKVFKTEKDCLILQVQNNFNSVFNAR